MSAFTRHIEIDQRVFLFLVGAIVTFAWIALGLWGRSPYARFLAHDEIPVAGVGSGTIPFLAIFLAGWTLMIVAMMLPTSLPLITLFRGLVRQRPDRMRLVLLVIGGYLTAWVIFGVLVHAGHWGLHLVIDQSLWLTSQAWLLGAGTLTLAGVYQFTPLKYHCLDKCRSPLAFIMSHWHGQHAGTQAFRLGVDHGVFCVGCCWSLMLLMFVVGMGNIGWMLLLGMIMAVEKNMPWGRQLSAPLGVVLIGAGLTITLITIL